MDTSSLGFYIIPELEKECKQYMLGLCGQKETFDDIDETVLDFMIDKMNEDQPYWEPIMEPLMGKRIKIFHVIHVKDDAPLEEQILQSNLIFYEPDVFAKLLDRIAEGDRIEGIPLLVLADITAMSGRRANYVFDEGGFIFHRPDDC